MRELLKTILQQFLEIVEPLEAELLDLLYAKDVLTFSDYESVRETKPGYSRKDRVSVGQGLGFWSFPVPFFSQFRGTICLELTAVRNVPTLFKFKFHPKTFLSAQAFH